MKIRLLFAAGALVSAMAVAGCGSSSNSKASTTTESTVPSKEQVCAARKNLEKSVAALADSSLLTGGKAGIDEAIDAVKNDVEELSDAAKKDYGDELDAVESSMNDLKAALGKFGDGSLTDNLEDAGNAIADVGSSAAALFSALQQSCPST